MFSPKRGNSLVHQNIETTKLDQLLTLKKRNHGQYTDSHAHMLVDTYVRVHMSLVSNSVFAKFQNYFSAERMCLLKEAEF